MSIARVLKSRSIPEILAFMLHRGIGLATASQRILPDFIIIGAQRCGTTSLFQYLCQHPEVYPSIPKEVHYFSNNYQKGINWYRSHFPLRSQKLKIISKNNGGFITGEATPYYLSHPHAPKRAAKVVPNARLIVLLRDPVRRAYSHYFHEVNMGIETLPFEEAIHKEEDRLRGEFDKLLGDETYRSFNYQHFSYLARGIYADQIERWLKVFKPDSMLVLNSSWLNKDPINTFRTVTGFLGLSDWYQIDASKYHTASYPPMEENIKRQLYDFFRPHNQRLYDLTNINLELDEKR